MKKMIFVLVLLVMIACGANAQVPEKVSKTFASMYKGASNVSWSDENGEYTASFKQNGKSKEAIFEEDGSWTQTTTFLSENDLLVCIKDHLDYEYPDAEFLEAEFIETPDNKRYYVLIENVEIYFNEEDEEVRNTENIQVVFDEDCNVVGED